MTIGRWTVDALAFFTVVILDALRCAHEMNVFRRGERLARALQGEKVMRLAAIITLCLAVQPTSAFAEDRILLAEILPALAGTDLGALELGAAPPPGTSRLVHRGEILAALRAAHRSPAGLAIPSSVRVERRARTLDADAIRRLAAPVIQEAVGTCTVASVRPPPRIIVPVGAATARVELNERLDSGSTAGTLLISVAGSVTRVPLQLSLVCPPPAIESGQRIRLVVRVGAVRASAPGEARQEGRVGEVIRVLNTESGAVLRGRVLGADSVEVVP